MYLAKMDIKDVAFPLYLKKKNECCTMWDDVEDCWEDAKLLYHIIFRCY